MTISKRRDLQYQQANAKHKTDRDGLILCGLFLSHPQSILNRSKTFFYVAEGASEQDVHLKLSDHRRIWTTAILEVLQLDF